MNFLPVFNISKLPASMNLAALVALWNVTQEHVGTSGARAAAGVLLGLYNGERFPLDLTDLRVLDANNLAHAVAVIGCDAARCEREVHDWLNLVTGRNDFGQRFEHLAHEWRRKGRCKRDELEPVSPARLVIKLNDGQPGACAPGRHVIDTATYRCVHCGQRYMAPGSQDDIRETGR